MLSRDVISSGPEGRPGRARQPFGRAKTATAKVCRWLADVSVGVGRVESARTVGNTPTTQDMPPRTDRWEKNICIHHIKRPYDITPTLRCASFIFGSSTMWFVTVFRLLLIIINFANYLLKPLRFMRRKCLMKIVSRKFTYCFNEKVR